jgi:hypothetical protein
MLATVGISPSNINTDSTHRFVTDAEKTEYSRLVPTAVKTANYNAVAGDFIPVDNTAGDITITLPTAPADKTMIGIKMVIQGGTNKVTYNTGGTDVINKAGGATSGALYLLSQAVLLQYKSSTGIWYVVADDLPLTQVQLASFNYAVCAGTNTLTCSLIPAITSYTDGLKIFIKTVNENTGAVTLNVNAVGAKSLVKNANRALVAGELKVGIFCAVYNSTTDAFHLLGPVVYEQAMQFVFYEGGTVLTTGVKFDFEVPYDCTVVGVDLYADQSGSIVLDLWKDTYANFPPTVADTVTASAKPTLSSASKSQDLTLTGWTTSFSKGDICRWNIDSVSTITRLTAVLRVIRK